MNALPETLTVVDSHTEGEPTRVVLGGVELPGATMAERRMRFDRDLRSLARAVICEPRGFEAIVGALLTPPVAAGSVAGVVFFNNAGTLGMCGHGLIGVVQTLAHTGRIGAGGVAIDTPVGVVQAHLDGEGVVTVRNVPARSERLDVELPVPGLGTVHGDVGWGGNWFFLAHGDDLELSLANLPTLLSRAQRIRDALDASDLLQGEGVIDHVELYGPPSRDDCDSKSFVLCPGGEYDRSPCGTGTSAKMAVLHARGALAIGQRWRQEGIAGGRFVGWLDDEGGTLVPSIQGRAWVTAESTLRFAADDPFRGGFSPR